MMFISPGVEDGFYYGFITHSVPVGPIWDDVEQRLGSALWPLILTQGLVLALLPPLMFGLNTPDRKAKIPADYLT